MAVSFNDLVAEVVSEKFPDSTKKVQKEIGDEIAGKMATALAAGDKIQKMGFGTLEVRKRAARTARNPQDKTAPPIFVPAHKVAVFKTGKELANTLNK